MPYIAVVGYNLERMLLICVNNPLMLQTNNRGRTYKGKP